MVHYNFDADQPILIIFDRDVAERVCYQTLDMLRQVAASCQAVAAICYSENVQTNIDK